MQVLQGSRMTGLRVAYRAAADTQAAVLVLAWRARGVIALLGHARNLVFSDEGINLLLPGVVRGPVRHEPMDGGPMDGAAHCIAPSARATATCAASTSTAIRAVRASASDAVRGAGSAVRAWATANKSGAALSK